MRIFIWNKLNQGINLFIANRCNNFLVLCFILTQLYYISILLIREQAPYTVIDHSATTGYQSSSSSN